MKGWSGDGGPQIGLDGDLPRHEVELDPLDSSAGAPDPEPAGPRIGRPALMIAAGIAAVIVLGTALLVSRDRVTGQLARPLATPVTIPTSLPPATVVPAPTPAAPLVSRAEATVTEPAAALARRQLASAGTGTAIAYLDTAGVTFLRLADGAVLYPEQTSSTYSLDAGVRGALLRTVDGGPTFGMIDGNLDRVEVMNSTGIFASTDAGGVYAFYSAAEGVAADPTAADLVTVAGFSDTPLTTIALPSGLRRTAVDGLGIVTFRHGDGSRAIHPDGVEAISDDWVIAGNSAARLEARCVGDRCALDLVDSTTAARVTAPAELSDATATYLVAPDASAVVHVDDRGAASVWRVGSATVETVAERDVAHATWAPDASYLAWFDLTGTEPILVLWLPGPRTTLEIAILTLGAPSPRSPAITAFADPG